ncbi:MAG: C40 family peptidase [Leptospiraceae bacterium]|nr:C40 family peptidase [Leptospiraceae bacterium]
MSNFRINYNSEWIDPDSEKKLRMDCSNTAKYIYKKVMDINLPRTSYDQFRLVEGAGNFTEAPKLPNGKIDSEKLKKLLKTGDLLFWTNTHSGIKEGLDPPIGHVMIYMGKDKNGNMKAGGANTFGKGRVMTKGGVDFYNFDPNKSMGCFKDKSGKCIRESEFVGFGKPPL